jgi:hypothetical protein
MQVTFFFVTLPHTAGNAQASGNSCQDSNNCLYNKFPCFFLHFFFLLKVNDNFYSLAPCPLPLISNPFSYGKMFFSPKGGVFLSLISKHAMLRRMLLMNDGSLLTIKRQQQHA